VLHVHDLVDYVSEEAAMVGKSAAAFLEGDIKPRESYIDIRPGEGVGYVLPQKVSGKRDFVLSLRVKEPYRDKAIMVRDGTRKVKRKKMVRLHPAEMIRIPVQAGKMGEIRSLEVCVE
jgi:hypothetical protein